MPSYLRPHAIEEALEALATTPLIARAGGTDYYPARVGKPCDEDILDIGGLAAPAILGATRHATGVRITQVPALPHRLRAAILARGGSHG